MMSTNKEKLNADSQPLHDEQTITVIITPSKKCETEQTPPAEGGLRSCLVCLASFWTNGALFGLINNFGVIYDYLKAKHENNRNLESDTTDSLAISLVGSLCIGVTFLLSPVAACLTDRFGIRKVSFVGAILAVSGIILTSVVAESLDLMYVTYGIIFGTGASLTYTPSLVILGHYFKKRLSLVNGIVAAGSGISTVCLPFLLKNLLEHFGLSTTLQILVVLMVPLLANAWVFVPTYTLKSNEQQNQCVAQFQQLASNWRNKKYVIWALAFPVSLLGYFVPYVHLVKHVKDTFPDYPGETLLMCIGGASLVGRIVFGFVADVPGVSRILLQQISFISIGILTMLIAAANAYWILIVICLGMGVFDGCFITLLGPIAFDFVGPQGASQAIGFLLGLCSIPLTLGAPIAGWMYDTMGKNYHAAFIAAGVPPIVGALLMFAIKLAKDKPPNVQSREMESMLKQSDTKETKLSNGDESEDKAAVWKKREDKLAVTPSTEESEKGNSELLERHSAC
ncbi:hypothetical protein CHUAL_007717 [Chamberlinius hualienensis]